MTLFELSFLFQADWAEFTSTYDTERAMRGFLLTGHRIAVSFRTTINPTLSNLNGDFGCDRDDLEGGTVKDDFGFDKWQ